ncbi:MAG: ankyrin repeat domain-containing protein, partial [Burkholderiales bacterium]
IRVPVGREAQWRDFAAWFARQRDAARGIDAHAAFEEMRGVLAAHPDGPLDLPAYLALGVRQSLFVDPAERERMHALFGRYRACLLEAGLFDLGLFAHAALAAAAPAWDFVAIDEVQDITPVQLALVLKTLKRPGHFLLAGDAHQIVHPNFFSWAGVRALFWGQDEALSAPPPAILAANFRNGREATRIANLLLRIKQARFGAVDRESSHLVEAVGEEAGQVALIEERPAALRDIDAAIRRSTACAVIVLREEDKAEARRHFATPLLFSVQEAKGLEYESVVLYRVVSSRRADFAAVAEGVPRAALQTDTLEYRRARDKEDKSLETYKFFVNALYVAITRAVKNVYWVESDTGHALFALLGLKPGGPARVEARAAGDDEWRREANRLELQGKAEQAQAIRATLLKEQPVPWPVFTQARVGELLEKIFVAGVPGGKPRAQLLDYAACHEAPALANTLSEQGFAEAHHFESRARVLARKHLMAYYAANPREALKQCEAHGPEHRLAMDITPLMAAAHAGHVGLVETLLARGANADTVDAFGCTALHWALREAFRDPDHARKHIGPLYALLAPATLDLKATSPGRGERLVRLDRRHAEYFLWQTCWALFKSRYCERHRLRHSGFETAALLKAWEHLPFSVLPAERRRRGYLSGLLARNEVARDYAYNRALFTRMGHGWYQINPALEVRRRQEGEEVWVTLAEALNLAWVNQLALPRHYQAFTGFAGAAGAAALHLPVAQGAAITLARESEARLDEEIRQIRQEAAERAKAAEEERQARARLRSARAAKAPSRSERDPASRAVEVREAPSTVAPAARPPPPWGTPAARELEIERIRREIEGRRARESGES